MSMSQYFSACNSSDILRYMMLCEEKATWHTSHHTHYSQQQYYGQHRVAAEFDCLLEAEGNIVHASYVVYPHYHETSSGRYIARLTNY